MNKSFVHKILSVVLGVALFVMLMTFVSLIFDAVLYGDIGSSEFVQWSIVGLICILVPTFVCYAFTFFAKSKLFSIFSAVLSLLVAACCIGFAFKYRADVLRYSGLTDYSTLLGYVQEMIQIIVPTLFACTYFILNTVNLFKNQNAKTTSEKANEEA